MMGGTFVNVGSATAFSLADLSVSGYSTDDGCWGEFMLQVLDNYGFVDTDEETGKRKAYYWQDNEDYDTACWTDSDGEEWDPSTSFDPGQAFWAQGAGFSLTCSGQVYIQDASIPTATIGNTALCNPFPCNIKLANMSVSGYSTDDGCWGEFLLQILDNYGFVAVDDETGKRKAYYWQDNEDYDAACWTDADGEEWDDNTEVAAGQGFWAQGAGYTIQFTNPVSQE